LLSVIPQGTAPLQIHAMPDLRVFGFTFLVSVVTRLISASCRLCRAPRQISPAHSKTRPAP
jgi:hypothetical protein